MNKPMMLSMSVAVVTLLAIAGSGLKAQESVTPAPSQGRESFMSAGCHHCHGQAAQGARGPTLAAMKYPYEAFEVFVRRPMGGGMPPYSKTQMPDAELREIYAYVVSLPGPAEQPPELLR